MCGHEFVGGGVFGDLGGVIMFESVGGDGIGHVPGGAEHQHQPSIQQ